MTEVSVPVGNPLDQLAFLLGVGGRVTKMSESPTASNGLYYCFVEVEVIEPPGSHFILHAYGQEALLLYNMADKETKT
jgi:hypothetical protein